jgi:hypothetical protein
MLKSFVILLIIASMYPYACAGQSTGGLEARRALAKATLEQINTAAEKFKTNCGVTVFDDVVPGEVDCGKGRETIGQAWSRTLNEAGYPATPQARRLAAQTLGLDSSATLIFYLSLVDNEKLDYLIKALKQIQSDGN